MTRYALLQCSVFHFLFWFNCFKQRLERDNSLSCIVIDDGSGRKRYILSRNKRLGPGNAVGIQHLVCIIQHETFVFSLQKVMEPFPSSFLFLDVHISSDYNFMYSRKWNAKEQVRWNQCVLLDLELKPGDWGCFKRKFLQCRGIWRNIT